jgi:serine/threonine protein phosphatase 1
MSPEAVRQARPDNRRDPVLAKPVTPHRAGPCRAELPKSCGMAHQHNCAAPLARQPIVPKPRRVYAIGDIHGRRDLLDRMIEEIRNDLAAYPVEHALTVTLGDYVDRGPDSRGVVERLAENPFPTEFVALKGNHEEMIFRFLCNPSFGSDWARNGGIETLHSYGIDVGPMMRGRGYAPAAAAFEKALPRAHMAFFASLRICLSAGRYFFCHAGVRPGVPFARQREHDLLWIRDEFLRDRTDFGKIVVHGHTPSPDPEIRPNRINVDTGAFMTGRLTCAVLEAERPRSLSAT